MKKVDKEPFSNGTQYMMFEDMCCDKCIKHSRIKQIDDTTNKVEYTKVTCSIERDIFTRMISNEPINERTITICDDFILHGKLCPYMKTHRRKYAKKIEGQTEMF